MALAKQEPSKGDIAYHDFVETLKKQEAFVTKALNSDTTTVQGGVSLLQSVERKQYYSHLLSTYERKLDRTTEFSGGEDSFEGLENVVTILKNLVSLWDNALKNASTKMLSASDIKSVATTAGRGIKNRISEKIVGVADSIIGKSSVTRSLTSAIANRVQGKNMATRAIRGIAGLTRVSPSASSAIPSAMPSSDPAGSYPNPISSQYNDPNESDLILSRTSQPSKASTAYPGTIKEANEINTVEKSRVIAQAANDDQAQGPSSRNNVVDINSSTSTVSKGPQVEAFNYLKFFDMRQEQIDDQWVIEGTFFLDEFDRIDHKLSRVISASGGGGNTYAGGFGGLGKGARGKGGIFKKILSKVAGSGRGLLKVAGTLGVGALGLGAMGVGGLTDWFKGGNKASVGKTPSISASPIGPSAAPASTIAKAAPSVAKTVTKSVLKGAGKGLSALSKALGPIGMVFAAYSAWSEAEELYAQNQLGQVSDEDFKTGLGRIVGGMLGGVGGAALIGSLGAIGGSAIPIVGTIIGGVAGGALGFIGGQYVGEELGGYIADQVLNPAEGKMLDEPRDVKDRQNNRPSRSVIDPDYDSSELGHLSSKYESNGDYGAIGFDKTGGHSYGKYQFASRTGTMKSFMVDLEENNPAMFAQLQSAGGNEGAIAGTDEFKAAWKSMSKDESFQQAQSDYTNKAYLNPALKLMRDRGVDTDKMSDTMKEVMLSTSVQHGGYTGSILDAISTDGSLEGMSEEDMIKSIYAERAKRFTSSTPNVRASVQTRLVNEQRDAQLLLARENEYTVASVSTASNEAIPSSSAKPADMPDVSYSPPVQTASVASTSEVPYTASEVPSPEQAEQPARSKVTIRQPNPVPAGSGGGRDGDDVPLTLTGTPGLSVNFDLAMTA